MGFLMTLIIGGLIGWLGSIVMKTNAEQGAILNILIGVIGAAFGRWLFGSVFKIGGAVSAGSFSIAGIFWGVLGAVILIGLLKAVHIL